MGNYDDLLNEAGISTAEKRGTYDDLFDEDQKPKPGVPDRVASDAKSAVGGIVSRIGTADKDGPMPSTMEAEGYGQGVESESDPATINMPGSVMHGRLAEKGNPYPAGAPVRPETRAGIVKTLEASTPQKRAAIAGREDWVGQVATPQMEAWQKQDELAADTPALEGMTRRVEDHRRNLIAAGMEPEAAANKAQSDVEMGAGTDLPGSVKASDMDFETHQKYKDAGTGERGLARGVNAVKKQMTGLHEFIGDSLGLDDYSAAMAGKRKELDVESSAIGDRSQYLTRNWEGALSSIVSQTPGLAISVLSGGSLPLLLMGAQVFGDEYATGKASGLSQSDATMRASVHGVAEIIGEKIGMPSFVKAFKAASQGVPTDELLKALAAHVVREVPGEQLTTAIQFSNDKFTSYGMNKSATLDDYLGQAADTFTQTIMQAGAMGSVGLAKNLPAARRLQSAEVGADVAKANALDKWSKAFLPAKNSPLSNAVKAGATTASPLSDAAQPEATSGTTSQAIGSNDIPASTVMGDEPDEQQNTQPLPAQEMQRTIDGQDNGLSQQAMQDSTGTSSAAVDQRGAEAQIQAAGDVPIIDPAPHGNSTAPNGAMPEANKDGSVSVSGDYVIGEGEGARKQSFTYRRGVNGTITRIVTSYEYQNGSWVETEKQSGILQNFENASDEMIDRFGTFGFVPEGSKAYTLSTPVQVSGDKGIDLIKNYLATDTLDGEDRDAAFERRDNILFSTPTEQKTTDPATLPQEPSAPGADIQPVQQPGAAQATQQRHDTIKHMVSQGFTHVNEQHELTNPKTGQTFPLTVPGNMLATQANAQIARAAFAKQINSKAHEAAASPNNDLKLPTPAQIEADNYKRAHLNLHGLDIAIENPKDSTRSGVSPEGVEWSSVLNSHYGYLKRTRGADNDPVDVFIGNRPDSDKVFVVDQVNPADGAFDEHKVLIGFTSEDDARKGYLANYESGWKGLGAITPMSMADFKTWLKEGDTTKPVSKIADAGQDAIIARLRKDATNINLGQISANDRAHEKSAIDAGIVVAVKSGVKEEDINSAIYAHGKTSDNLAALLPTTQPVGNLQVTQEPATTPVSDNQPDSNVISHDWIKPEIEALIHQRANAGQIGKGGALDKLIALAKRYLNGESIRPVQFKSFLSDFKNLPAVTEIVQRIMGAINSGEHTEEPKTKIVATEADKAKRTELVKEAEGLGIKNAKFLRLDELPDAIKAKQEEFADLSAEEVYSKALEVANNTLSENEIADIEDAVSRKYGDSGDRVLQEEMAKAFEAAIHAKQNEVKSEENQGNAVESVAEEPKSGDTESGGDISGKTPEGAARGQQDLTEPSTPPANVSTNSENGDTSNNEEVHSGYVIKPIKVRSQGEVVDRWNIQSESNREIAKSGGRESMGDRLFNSKEEAIAGAAEQKERVEKDRIYSEQRNAEDAKLKAETDARIEANRGLTITERKANATLDKQHGFKGQSMSLRDIVKTLVNEGAELTTEEVNKIKDMSRREFNRADNREQAAHEQKVREGGKKTVYYVGDYDLGKTAYDYAMSLKNAPHDAEKHVPVESKSENEQQPNPQAEAITKMADAMATMADAVKQLVNPDHIADAGKMVEQDQEAKSEEASNQAIPNKGVTDSGRVAIKKFRDLIPSQSIHTQSFSDMNIETQRSMVSSMIGAIGEFKVRDAIVHLIPVDVMDNLVGEKRSSNMFLQDPSVLTNALSIEANGRFSVAVAGFFDSLRNAPASVRAEVLDGLGKAGRGDSDRLPTIIAGSDDLGNLTGKVVGGGAEMGHASDGTIPLLRESDTTVIANDINHNSSSLQKNIISDFGQKIEGSRKDLAAAISKELGDDEIATMPLSKIWPADLADKIEDKFIAALAFAARAEIPSKPRKSYAVSRWVEKVKGLRGMVNKVLSSDAMRAKAETLLNERAGLKDFTAKVALLEEIDRSQWGRIGTVGEYPDAYRYEGEGADTKKVASPMVKVVIDGATQYFKGVSSVTDAIDQINEKLGVEAKTKRMAFEVRGTDSKGYGINKKGDSEYRRLKTFKTAKEALDYRNSNYDDLVAAWEDVKNRDNVKKDDVRGESNRPRTAEDYRQGKDISTEQFQSTFGFRGGQFGKWVSQGSNAKERQWMLNSAYDALMDLSNILNIPPKAISLNGELGMAFGARGSGAASAHYESDTLVINLTKTRGAGTLAHEWFHALDNYFQRGRGALMDNKRESRFITYAPEAYYEKADGTKMTVKDFDEAVAHDPIQVMHSQDAATRKIALNQRRIENKAWWKKYDAVRPEVETKFAELVQALNESPMTARASIIDKGKPDGYWSRIIERAARSFENYVIAKMAENGYHNDYLANVVNIAEFKRDTGRYPYLKDEELAPVVEAFDNLFATLKTKETDQGTAIYKNAANIIPENEQLSASQLLDIAEQAISQLGHKPSIMIVDSLSHITGRADDAGRASGLVKNGKIYLFRDAIAGGHEAIRTVWHELLHYGIRRFLTADQYINAMQSLAMSDDFVRKQARAWANSPEADESREYASKHPDLKSRVDEYAFARGVDEALAMFAESIGPNGATYAKNDAYHKSLRAVRSWLGWLADKIGMKSVGDWIRGKDNQALREYAHMMLGKLRNDDAATSDDWGFTADGAFMRKAPAKGQEVNQGGDYYEQYAESAREFNDLPEASRRFAFKERDGVADTGVRGGAGRQGAAIGLSEWAIPEFMGEGREGRIAGGELVALPEGVGGADAWREAPGNLRGRAVVIADRSPREFSDGRDGDLVGETVRTPLVLAKLAQIYRHPGYETFRYFFTKNGVIVGQNAVTSRLPGSSVALLGKTTEEQSEWGGKIADEAVNSGADAVWFLHNHPDGVPVPSDADIDATYHLAQLMKGRGLNFRGHVIINHNRYGTVSLKETALGTMSKPAVATYQFSEKDQYDFNHPRVAHALLGQSVASPEDLAKQAKQSQVSPGQVVVIGKSGNYGISLIAELTPSQFRSEKMLIAKLRQLARQTGSGQLYLYGVPYSMMSKAEQAIRNGIVDDVLLVNDRGALLSTVGLTGARADAGKHFGLTSPGQEVEMTAWHGSPHDHDKFDSSKIGTGEGAQAYGFGHYFAGAREVAEWYRDNVGKYANLNTAGSNISGRHIGMPDIPAPSLASSIMSAYLDGGKDGAMQAIPSNIPEQWIEKINSWIDEKEKTWKGRLYQVELAPAADEYLDWDKPLSEQSEKVKTALESLSLPESEAISIWGGVEIPRAFTGENIYKRIAWNNGKSDKSASEYLHSIGIRGISYLDGSSRSAGEGNSNFVIFDDADVSITMKFSRNKIGGGVMASQARLYSQLRVAIRDMSDKIFQGTAANVRLHLMNNLGKYGLKKDEIFWTGLEDFLSMPGKVSKADVLGFLDENAVTVKDEWLGDIDESEIEAFLNDEAGEGFTREEAIDFLRQDQENGKAKFPTQVLPGGRDYLELLITLPAKAEDAAERLADQIDREYRAHGNSERYSELLKEQKQLREQIRSGTFTSSHYPDAKNLIAHVRLNTRDDAQGRVGTFAEEFQSDASIAGSKSGFIGSDAPVVQDIVGDQIQANGQWYHAERIFGKPASEFKIGDKVAALGKSTIPPMPFVTSATGKGSTAHTLLSLKKVILHAIEQGHEFVSWTTGTQQKDRYSLSKQVDAVAAYKNSDGTYYIQVEKNGAFMHEDAKLPEAKLEELLGKDLAAKIIAGEGHEEMRDGAPFRVYSGLDLDIGGEWADALYGDENGLDANGKPSLMSQAVKEVARQLGIELKVEGIAIQGNKSLSVEFNSMIGGWDVMNGMERISHHETENEALSASRMIQPGFAIADALRSKVTSAGMPLFSRNRNNSLNKGENNEQRSITPALAADLETAEDQADAQALNDSLVRYHQDERYRNAFQAVAVFHDDAEAARVFGVAFKKRVSTVAPTRAEFAGEFEGFRVPSRAGVLFVSYPSRNIIALAGHELYHDLAEKHPELHEWMLGHLATYEKNFSGYVDNLNHGLKENEKHDNWSAAEELLSDFTGDALADPEFLAQIAKDNPGKFTELLTAIKQWLNKVIARLQGNGSEAYITDVKALRDHLAKALQVYANGGDIAAEVGTLKFSKNEDKVASTFGQPTDGVEFAHEVLAELADIDEMFRYPISQSMTLEGNMEDALPGVEYLGEDTREDERSESGADHRFSFKSPNEKPFYVYRRGKEVWIDVSRMEEGEKGGAVYHAVANYAFNTGHVFVGDPAGLSEAAIVRRTSHMLSFALRFGTIKHVEAAPEQIKGVPEKGIAPLNWHGNDVAKVRALIDTFVSTLENQFPGIKEYHYEFGRNRFVDSRGRPVDSARLERGERSPMARTARAGEATLRRGIFLKSLASSESSQRPGILEHVLRGSRSLVKDGGLKMMFSRTKPQDGLQSNNSHAVTELNAAIEAQEGIVDAFAPAKDFDLGLVDAYRSVFGIEITPIVSANQAADGFPGITFNGRIYVNTAHARYSFSALAGHELLHQLKLDNRQLYDAFAEMARKRAVGGIGNALHAYGAHSDNQGYAQSDLLEELLGDFVGDALSDREFLGQMAQENPNLFRQFADYVLNWLDGVAKKLTASGFGSSQYFDDVQGMRNELLAVLKEYSESKAPDGEMGEGHEDRTGRMRFRRETIVGDSGRKYTPEQQTAMDRTGSVVTHKSIQETIKGLWQGAGKKLAQGLVDQFRPVRDLSAHAYTLMRLSKGATGAFEAFMHHGKLSLRDGAFDADTSGGVLETVFFPLGKESTDFLRWVAGNRAERLAGEGKENLFTPEDIAAFKSLADGVADFDYTLADGSVTRDRPLIYADSLKKFNEFNKNVLDMAEQSGLIDGASRALWEHEFYVPFYRAADEEDGGVRGMNIKSGVVRQQAFQKLKGGEQQLNDLLENTLMNWAHLIDASAKNRAAKATLEAAALVGAARPATSGEKKTVWFMDNGKKVEYKVEDPHLMEAINSLEYAGLRSPVMNAMSSVKHWLTIGVTASPFFKVRNLIRDSVQAIGTASNSDMSYNPLSNIKKGYKLTDRASQEYVSALAGGGLIRFGTMLEGSEAKRTRQLIKQGAKDAHILDNENKIRAFYDKYVEPGIAAYNELGNRGEEINRMALYDTLIKQGVDHATASLMARDLMDFSMQGTWSSIRFLTQTVPFMNARLQGLYKLGRAANEDKARFAIVLGAVSVASLALLAAYGDDDDWRKREDWDRDNYWWFKIGGVAFRIPKPFEIGAIATLAERSAELLFDNEMTGKRFAHVTTKLLSDQLAMNPVPQLFKPIIDLYANHDSFTGRQIESAGMERIAPDHRFNQSTSMVARGVSTAGNAVTGDNFLSPVQVDHVVRAYFGWLGTFSVASANVIIRLASNEPDKPAADYFKVATGGMIAGLDGERSRYVSQMYDQARELEQVHGTWRNLLKEGKKAEAKEYREDHKKELAKYPSVELVKRQAANVNKRIWGIEHSRTLSADEKKVKINTLRRQQDKLARQLTVN